MYDDLDEIILYKPLKRNSFMDTQKMYASGLICKAVCSTCTDKPCPHRTWLERNACPRIINYNEELGRCCATCLHLVAEKYCGERARDKKITVRTNLSPFLVADIFNQTCDKWTNEFEDTSLDNDF